MMPEIVLILLFVAAAVAAMLVSNDARKRGWDALPWALLVFFLPVIGVCVYLIAIRTRRTQNAQ